MAHVDPVDAALRAAAGAAHGVDDGVEAVSDDAVDAAHTGGLELGGARLGAAGLGLGAAVVGADAQLLSAARSAASAAIVRA